MSQATPSAGPAPPPASFETLVNLLGVQTLAALGQIAEPGSKEMLPVNLELARHFIDTLAMLETKTKGNLTPGEGQLLTTAISQLRMLYLEGGKK